MPVDEHLFANETASLCLPKAWRDFRVQFEVFSSNRPALIAVSTDGYANSYRDDAGFLKVAPDILAMIRSAGTETVRAELDGWLAEVTRHPTNPNVWGLKNTSLSKWVCTLADRTVREVEPGKNVPLGHGVKIQFGKVEGEILV
jgi:hypothetical protein